MAEYECRMCTANIVELSVLQEEDLQLEFLLNHKLIEETVSCGRCGDEARIKSNKGKLKHICNGWYDGHDRDGNPKRTQCNFRQSIFLGTWFYKSKLSINQVVGVAKMYLAEQFDANLTMELMKINKNTLTDYSNFIREICTDYVKENCMKIGGPNVIVQIDEAKFGRRKYHRGRIIEGQWIFGGIEENGRRCFFIPVADRTKETLLAIIKEWIHPESTIISDCWKSYDCLESEGFLHLKVNHTYNFVDPDTGANTNLIERQWRDLRGIVQKMGAKVDYPGHFARVMFLKKFYSQKTRQHVFWNHVGKMYREKRLQKP